MATKKTNIKRWTLAELRAKNKLFFDRKTQKFFGVQKSVLITGKNGQQYYIEKQKMTYSDHTTSIHYHLRPVPGNGNMVEAAGKMKDFETLASLKKFIGKEFKI